MVAVEAMALGKAVVATDVGGLPETVKDGITGILVPPDDIDALAEAIYELLSNPQRRKTMGARARVEARQQYHPKEVAQRCIDVFEEVLEKNKSSRN